MATHSSILAWRFLMHRRAWCTTIHEIAKSQTQLSDEHTHTTTMEGTSLCITWRQRVSLGTYGGLDASAPWRNLRWLQAFYSFVWGLISRIFALFTQEGFLISPCYSLEFCLQLGISYPFSFAFCFSYFLSLFVSPPQAARSPSCISFS